MTERLYHQDAYCARFDATVLGCEALGEGRHLVRLDRSAFYPTSGGQPFDKGHLGGARVLEVYPDERGDVAHIVDAPLTLGARVEGVVDWARRFDHMQQHAGDHMMAGVIHHMLGGYTVGLHLGADISTIDVVLNDGRTRLDEAEIEEIERRVNAQIQQNLPIRCWFPDEAEMAALPLRKDPSVSEHIRVVMVGDVECVACGGTHVSSSGQIGLLKILDARPSRGKLRISFVCGMRAVHDYQMKSLAAERAAALVSAPVQALPGAVERALERVRHAEYELSRWRLRAALELVPLLLEGAEPLQDGWRAVCTVTEGLGVDAMREVGSALTKPGKTYALLASGQDDGAHLLFMRSAGSGAHMGEMLSSIAQTLGGKGGGKAEFAQGAANGMAALEAARALLHEKKGD